MKEFQSNKVKQSPEKNVIKFDNDTRVAQLLSVCALLLARKKNSEQELELSTFKNMVTDEGEVTPYRYKIIDFKTRKAEFTDSKNQVQKKSLDCKLLITFSEKRKERDLANLEAMLVQAQDAVIQNKEITHKFSGWQQFVETNTGRKQLRK